MQIHELNTLNGNLGADVFVAVDNGNDTGKVSVPNLTRGVEEQIEQANARIDNIIAGGDAPSEAEIIDARLGSAALGGVPYASLGAAIRGQATVLSDEISEGVGNITDLTYLSNFFYKANTVKATDGSEVSNSGYDLYRVPLESGHIVQLEGSDEFWGAYPDGYNVGVELTDDSYITNSTNNLYYILIDYRCTAYGRGNTRYLYFIVSHGHEDDVKIWIDYPFPTINNNFLSILQMNREIDQSNAIRSQTVLYNDSKITNIGLPYYTLSMPVKAGDKFKFKKAISGLSYNATFRSLSWEVTNVLNSTLEFDVSSDGIISIYGSTNESIPNATYYPATSIPLMSKEEFAEKAVVKKGNGVLNPSNLIKSPKLTNDSNWNVIDNGTGGSYSFITTDDYSNIFEATPGSAMIGLNPELDEDAVISSCLISFMFKGEFGSDYDMFLVGSAKINGSTVAIVNNQFNVWDRTNRDWVEIRIEIPLTSEATKVQMVLYFQTRGKKGQIKNIYIGETEWGSPFVVNNGLEYVDVSDQVLKTLSPKHDKTIVCFGDSLTDNGFTTGRDMATCIKYESGINTVVNAGFGGCQMAEHHTNYYDPFSMYRLAYSIANNDWSEQDAVMSLSPIPANAQRKIEMLKTIDFDYVDTVTIEYGTNDWANGSQMDNAQDKYDTDTIGGALRYSIETLLTAFPYLKIVIVSIAWRCRESGGIITIDSDTDTNSRGNTVPEINDLLKSIADEYHLSFVDVYNNTSFNRKTYIANFQDGIHPGYNGRKTMASLIAKRL